MQGAAKMGSYGSPPRTPGSPRGQQMEAPETPKTPVGAEGGLVYVQGNQAEDADSPVGPAQQVGPNYHALGAPIPFELADTPVNQNRTPEHQNQNPNAAAPYGVICRDLNSSFGL